MKRKFQLFSLTKGEQRVVLLIVIGLLLGAAYRLEQRPPPQSTVPTANPGATAPPVEDEEQAED